MMDSFIYNFNYEVSTGTENSVDIKKLNDTYAVYVNNIKWMNFNSTTKQEALELKAHYDLAYGNVIVTGLGIGIREQLLLSKTEVKSVTVLEKSTDLVNFHRKNSKWYNNPKLTVVNTSADKYKGECDVLLLDHYEQQNFVAILNDVKQITSQIKTNVAWFWPFEVYILTHYWKYNKTSLLDSYETIKGMFNLQNFPKLTETQLINYCDIFKTPYYKSIGLDAASDVL